MTRKDFQFIAKIIKNIPVDQDPRRVIALTFAYKLNMNDGLFDADEFLEECNVKPLAG
tara:strand:- start:1156 stop:1329 length:174 start_codon:yes stop_codon:yes gene_type:complete